MSWDAIRRIVEERVTDEWTDASVPFVFEEQKHEHDWNTWMRVTVRFDESENAALGKLIRYPGRVIVQVFAPKGKGTGASLRISEAVAALFQNQTFGHLTFYAGSIIQAGQREQYIQHNVYIPFFYQ